MKKTTEELIYRLCTERKYIVTYLQWMPGTLVRGIERMHHITRNTKYISAVVYIVEVYKCTRIERKGGQTTVYRIQHIYKLTKFILQSFYDQLWTTRPIRTFLNSFVLELSVFETKQLRIVLGRILTRTTNQIQNPSLKWFELQWSQTHPYWLCLGSFWHAMAD